MKTKKQLYCIICIITASYLIFSFVLWDITWPVSCSIFERIIFALFGLILFHFIIDEERKNKK